VSVIVASEAFGNPNCRPQRTKLRREGGMLSRQGVNVGILTSLGAGRKLVEKLHQNKRVRVGERWRIGRRLALGMLARIHGTIILIKC
jgi:hypothetical protein